MNSSAGGSHSTATNANAARLRVDRLSVVIRPSVQSMHFHSQISDLTFASPLAIPTADLFSARWSNVVWANVKLWNLLRVLCAIKQCGSGQESD